MEDQKAAKKPRIAGPDTSCGDDTQTKFPHRLFQLLNDEVAPNALWWLPGGKSFAIEQASFAQKVLDPFLQGAKLQSFVRRLHKWGFHRETRQLRKLMGQRISKSVISFSHELFQRDKAHLLNQMKEVSSNNAKAKSGSPNASINNTAASVLKNTLNNRDSTALPLSSASAGRSTLAVSGHQGIQNSLLSSEVTRLRHGNEGGLPYRATQVLPQQQHLMPQELPPHSMSRDLNRTSLSNLAGESALLQVLRQQRLNELLLDRRLEDVNRRTAAAQQEQQQQLQSWETAAARLSRATSQGYELGWERGRLNNLLVGRHQQAPSLLSLQTNGNASGGLPISGAGNQHSNTSRNFELLNALLLRDLQGRQNQGNNSNK